MQIEVTSGLVLYRPMIAGDASFIFSSWLKSYRRSPRAASVAGAVYYSEHQRVVGKILERSQVCIASSPENPAQILGYIVFENIGERAVFHYVYVKQPFRGLGIGRMLARRVIGGGQVFHSHATPEGDGLSKRLGSIFNPYLAQ